MADEALTWKRPSDVMMKRKKKLVIKQRPLLQENGSGDSKTVSPRPSPKSVKRRNPFGCSATKRVALSESPNFENHSTPTPSANGYLFRVLDGECSENATPRRNIDTQAQMKALGRLQEDVDDTSPVGVAPRTPTLSLADKILNKDGEESEKLKYFDYYPVDWSLRTKARFISSKPFNWSCQMSSAEECSGTVGFVKGSDTAVPEPANQKNVHSDTKGEFKQLTCYWMHPHLPWFKLFPRNSADSKAGKPSPSLHDESVQASLMSDWSESLTSAFQHLRCGFCPYFYLCCHHLTVLFRASGVAGHPDMHALITPTSRGFRNVIKEEGIEYSMPLNPNHKSSKEGEDGEQESEEMKEEDSRNEDATGETKKNREEVDEDDMDDADDAASSWLKDLGLDAAKFRSLDPAKIKLQRQAFKNIDQRPESVIVVEGSDVQALFNYLLNSTNLVSPTGWQAGIPPTIIAPTAFKGATLKSHQVKSGSVRLAVGEPNAYSLDVIGPIMPNCLDGLLSLFSHTQESYSVSFSVHEPSTSLNALPKQNEESDAEECCVKAAVPSSHLRNITKNYELTKFALREVNCESGRFAWIL